MTREDVKKHLAKSPLEWKKDEYSTYAKVILMDGEDDFVVSEDFVDSEDFSVIFEIQVDESRKSSKLTFITGRRRYPIVITSGYRIPDEDLKALAEEHRLRMACRLLGIKD